MFNHLELSAMRSISPKKIVISYLISSAVIFLITAISNAFGLFGHQVVVSPSNLSNEAIMAVQLIIVLATNLVFHFIFYYGGLHSSPIAKGVGIGTAVGLVYFMVTVFGLNLYDLNTAPVQELVGALTGRVVEYSSGGIATAFVSVSNMHKWGLLKTV